MYKKREDRFRHYKKIFHVKNRRLAYSVLSIMLCLALAACGKNEVIVDDYGTDSKDLVSDSSQTDSSMIVESGGKTLQDLYGKTIDWTDDFTVNNTRFVSDLNYKIPDIEYMNAYYSKEIEDGADVEEEIVKSIFGDTAKKLDKIKYTNETDYMTMMYKYRQIVNMRELGQKLQDREASDSPTDIINVYDRSVISASNNEEYKWIDENNFYIHMYEGKYQGIRFGLIISYDYSNHRKSIFFEPISIKEYFPEYEAKTLLITTSNDSAGNPLDIDNKCTMSIEDVKTGAKDFLKDKLKLGDRLSIIEQSNIYEASLYDNIASFMRLTPHGSFDRGASILRFTDSDYISTIKYMFEGDAVDYSRLAEQQDLYSEYKEKNDKDIYSFLTSSSVKGESDINSFVDGYAVYLNDGHTIMDESMFFGIGVGNTGIVKYTSKGLYGVDVTLFDETIDVTENVKLLEFDKITDCLKNNLKDKYTPESLDNPANMTIYNIYLCYYPYKENEDSKEFMYVPTWCFYIGKDNGRKSMMVYENAMDGTIMDISYMNY